MSELLTDLWHQFVGGLRFWNRRNGGTHKRAASKGNVKFKNNR